MPQLKRRLQDADPVECPDCKAVLRAVRTAYGFRATCTACLVRWTWIEGEHEWTKETYSPMADNLTAVRTHGGSTTARKT